MAGVFASFSTGEVACTTTTAKTILQLVAPTNQRVRLKSLSLTFDGTSTTAEPVAIRVLRQTSAIGGSPTTVTGVRTCAGSETVQTTAAQSAGGTEPTASDVLFRFNIHPQGGIVYPVPLDLGIEIPGGTRLGVEVTAPATVNCMPLAIIEE